MKTKELKTEFNGWGLKEYYGSRGKCEVNISKSEEFFITTRMQEGMKLWNIDKSDFVHKFQNSDSYKCSAIAKNDLTIFAGEHIGKIKAIDLLSKKIIKSVYCFKNIAGGHYATESMDLSKNGRLLAVGSYDGRFELWETKNLKRLYCGKINTDGTLLKIKILSNNMMLYRCSKNSVGIFDLIKRRLIKVFNEISEYLSSDFMIKFIQVENDSFISVSPDENVAIISTMGYPFELCVDLKKLEVLSKKDNKNSANTIWAHDCVFRGKKNGAVSQYTTKEFFEQFVDSK